VNTWKIILATMVIFGAGVVTGGLLVHHSQRAEVVPARPGGPRPFQPPPSPVGLRVEFLRRAQRELDLSQDQREQIERIIKESQDRTRHIMEPISPRLREEVELTRKDFIAVLTPPQRTRFEEMVKQQQQKNREQHRAMPHNERQTENPTNRAL
jgi:Spy/CpxP family protein refolding chaperone